MFLSACNSSATNSNISVSVESKQSLPHTKVDKPPIVDPTVDGRSDSKALKNAWKRFTANGQYRLAQKEDMRFSEAAKEKMGADEGFLYIPYVYIWGDLAYKKRSEDEHLAVVVVDTKRNDDNRFSLVIFSPAQGSHEYKIHWLYRDRDLSKISVSRASGSFFVSEHLDDGTLKTCIVHWYRSRKQFECKAPGVIS